MYKLILFCIFSTNGIKIYSSSRQLKRKKIANVFHIIWIAVILSFVNPDDTMLTLFGCETALAKTRLTHLFLLATACLPLFSGWANTLTSQKYACCHPTYFAPIQKVMRPLATWKDCHGEDLGQVSLERLWHSTPHSWAAECVHPIYLLLALSL